MKFSIAIAIFLASMSVWAESNEDVLVNEEGVVIAPANLWEANIESIRALLAEDFVNASDARLSDAREPLPHGEEHKYGGSDQIGSDTPMGDTIPIASWDGTLDGWISTASESRSGIVYLANEDIGGSESFYANTAVTPTGLINWWTEKAQSPLRFANGTASEPTYSFTDASNSGLYRHTNGSVRVSIGGVEKARFQPTGESLYVVGNLAASGHMFSQIVMTNPGSATAARVSQVGDENTGIYYPGSDEWAVSTGGVRRLNINTTEVEFGLNVKVPSLIVGLGSAAYPSFAFDWDEDTGIYNAGANNIGFTVDGTAQSGVNIKGPYISVNGKIVQTWKGSRNVAGHLWERAVATLSGNGSTGTLTCTYAPSADPTGLLVAITGASPASWNGVYKVTAYNSTTGAMSFATTNTATYVSGGKVSRFLPLVKITGTGDAEITGTLTALSSNSGTINCAHTTFGSAYARCQAGTIVGNYFAGYTGANNAIQDPTNYGSPAWWTGSYREDGAAYWGVMRFYYNGQSSMTPNVVTWLYEGIPSGPGTITVDSTGEY